ncbi:hypothetical protein [Flavobacterium facile]|uniref:hypothetical protein n=1 Tax=Flavobacterium facile TaxID=2893174 RepID=UPI002E771D75|nr:hypothetical protein [Flavobacterium sp. T-12]
MAKVKAPFKIKGTLDDLSFYIASEENLVRQKGNSGITKEQFAKNPIFDRIRQQSSEFGSCSQKSKVFRLLAKQFYDKAKEVSFAGRVNKLLFEILQEDTTNKIGERKIENGLQIPEIDEILVHFEGNKLRPLKKVLKKEITFDWKQNKCNLTSINVEQDILWPEQEANQIHLQLAIANWNCKDDEFENQYSNEIILEKENTKKTIDFKLEQLQTKDLWIAYLFIGFSYKERRNAIPLHKKWNTTTIIGIKNLVRQSRPEHLMKPKS